VDWSIGLSGVLPDSVRCTRAVPVPTSHSRENTGAIRYNSPDCPVPPDYPVRQRETTIQHATVDSDNGKSVAQCAAEVRAVKSEGTGLSGAVRGQSPNG
jgi:hypothetical protein